MKIVLTSIFPRLMSLLCASKADLVAEVSVFLTPAQHERYATIPAKATVMRPLPVSFQGQLRSRD